MPAHEFMGTWKIHTSPGPFLPTGTVVTIQAGKTRIGGVEVVVTRPGKPPDTHPAQLDATVKPPLLFLDIDRGRRLVLWVLKGEKSRRQLHLVFETDRKPATGSWIAEEDDTR